MMVFKLACRSGCVANEKTRSVGMLNVDVKEIKIQYLIYGMPIN
jgi:hypothetical protein